MNSTNVIKKPILSEKAYSQMEKGVYAFLVDQRASKEQIAESINKRFSVEVKKVNVLAIKPKSKRVARTRKFYQTSGGKKALVYLKSGQSIAMLLPQSATKEKSKKKEDKKGIKSLIGKKQEKETKKKEK